MHLPLGSYRSWFVIQCCAWATLLSPLVQQLPYYDSITAAQHGRVCFLTGCSIAEFSHNAVHVQLWYLPRPNMLKQ